MDLLVPGALFVGAYLVGALPFGWLIARARGVDIFAQGSGNIGATNVGRVLGRRFGIVVFLLDFAKGAMPVAAGRWLESAWPHEGWPAGLLPVLAGLAAFLGHLFPLYLRFRGGKGVATGAGVAAILVPLPFVLAFLTWLVILAASRYVSLASVVSALVLCLVQGIMSRGDFADPRFDFALLAGVLVVVRHRANLVRLWNGVENRLPETPAMSQLPKVLHVLALGLWFGMSVAFTFVVTPLIFDTFEKTGHMTPEQRPGWFPASPGFAKKDSELDGPKEQGTRAAGALVGPMLPWYFLLQGACGLIALATSFTWTKAGKVHRWRTGLLTLALLGVLAGWPIEEKVSDLRIPRNQAVDQYLHDEPGMTAAKMKEARGEFGKWHLVSLLLNFVTILAVTGAMGMAAAFPSSLGGEGPRVRGEKLKIDN